MAEDNNNEEPKKIRIAPEEIEIDDEEGFEGHDLFGYSQFGNTLANIFQKTLGLRTVLLDDEWGSGKTVFVKQWAGLLRQRQAKVVYIDAFENDYQPDPFLMLVTEITAKIPANKRSEHYISASAKTLEILATNATKAITAGIVDSTAIADAFEKQLNAAEEEKKSLENFRKELGATAQNFEQLVVIVDELDRCRPDFALRLLERVKHLFDVEGVSFLLVASSKTLIQMVRHAYGFKHKQAVRYLEKFLTLRTSLPKATKGVNLNRREIYAKYLANVTVGDDPYAVSQHNIYDALGRFAIHCDMDLRTIEKIYFSFIAVCANEKLNVGFRNFALALCFVKLASPESFRSILATGTCDWTLLSETLNLNNYQMSAEDGEKLWPIFQILHALFASIDEVQWMIDNRDDPYARDALNGGFVTSRGGRVRPKELAKALAANIEATSSFS